MARIKDGIMITDDTFRQLHNLIEEVQGNKRHFRQGMDTLTQLYALTTVGIARGKSRGPHDPTQRHKDLAWRVPVRRISEDYYNGWQARRIAQGHWEVINRSREAFFIEYGINHRGVTGRLDSGGNRNLIRRPVLKLSVIAAIRLSKGSGAEQRIVSNLFVTTGRGMRRGIIPQGVQSPRVMGTI